MPKVLIVIAPVKFQEHEYHDTRQVLEQAGCEIHVASTAQSCLGKQGMTLEADLLLQDVRGIDYAAIVLIGGPGALSLVGNKELESLLKEFQTLDKVIAAICIAPVILAQAGVLEKRHATVFPDPEAEEKLKKAGALLNKQEVILDGKTITANGPAAATRFGHAILGALKLELAR